VHFRITFATIALLGMCAAPSAFGQGTQASAQAVAPAGPKNGPSSIALVDVGYILKQHPTMNTNMEAIKAEMTQAQEDIETRRKSLLAETEMVGKNYNQDSPEFKQKQETLISQESKLRVDFMGKEKEFAEKQAGVIFSSYQSINQAISVVAKHYQYDLVLRYSREQNEMDPKKPQSVNFGIQRDVLFLNPQVDVTELVLNVLKSNVGASAPAPSATPTQQPLRSANGPGNNPIQRK
jgi:Skp family chaperone for outer membrane proteins